MAISSHDRDYGMFREPVGTPRPGWCWHLRLALACLLGAGPVTGGAASLNTGLVYHPDYLLHQPGSMHPERPARLTAIVERLQAVSLWKELVHIEPRPVEEQWLLTVHGEHYLQQLADASRQAPLHLDPDTGISPDSLRVARLAAGGVLAAVDAVMAGRVRNAFAAVRPPGHHALPDRAMGFCLFNNVAVAARYLQRHHGIDRVLIVDWDVHHGNGTQAMFYEDASVLYFSTHQAPFYPGTGSEQEIGAGAGEHTVINAPLPSGTGDEDILAAFEDRLLPAAETFKPQFVLVSAGFDGHHADPLAQFRLTEEGYSRLTKIVLGIAERHAGGRVVSMLEGGYDLDALARSVEAHIRAMLPDHGSGPPVGQRDGH